MQNALVQGASSPLPPSSNASAEADSTTAAATSAAATGAPSEDAASEEEKQEDRSVRLSPENR